MATKLGGLAAATLLGLQMVLPVVAVDTMVPGATSSPRPQVPAQKRMVVGQGKITAISGTTIPATLTVLQNGTGTSWTVMVDASTRLRRRFWGVATLAEMQVGDTVTVRGFVSTSSTTTIQAILVRDLSIQKRNDVFFGTVTSLNANGWVMTVHRTSTPQTVMVSGTTKYVDRRGRPITQANIAVGNRLRVRGLWDRANNNIQATLVKDYSIPTPTAGTGTQSGQTSQ